MLIRQIRCLLSELNGDNERLLFLRWGDMFSGKFNWYSMKLITFFKAEIIFCTHLIKSIPTPFSALESMQFAQHY